MKQAGEPDSVGQSINETNGNLLCPQPKCGEEITRLIVAKENVPEKVFYLLEKLKTDFETKKVVDKALKELEARMINEREKLMANLDKEEREAELMRLDIVENVLTLRCPRCKTAFLDFTGCAALTCF